MLRLFPFLIIILCLAGSCKKEEDPEPDPIPATSYSYLSSACTPYKFKVGSYWVYENDSTGLLDSVIVDNVNSGFLVTIPSVHGTTGSTKSEFYKINFHAFGTSEFYHHTLFNGFYARNFSGNDGVFTGQKIYVVNSAVGTSYDGMTIISKSPSMPVGLTTFSNVDEVEIIAADQSLPEFAFDTHLYFCDSVGLIKKESIISPGNIESWSLKRWNIIR